MSKISSVSFLGSENKEQKNRKNIKGAIGASIAGSVAPTVSLPVGLLAVRNLTKPSQELTKDQVTIVNDAAQKTLSEVTKLSKKGVKIIDCNGKSSFFSELLPEWMLNMISPIDATANGKNAFFFGDGSKRELLAFELQGIDKNSVCVNKDKLPLATFHEMGHAFNFNNSKFWKSMQKVRSPLMIAGSLMCLLPAFTKEHKAKEGEELTRKQKFVNGLRKASPFLAVASFVPMVAEESMATIRGNKWAKEVFKDAPELAKKVAKSNKWGLVSYVVTALAAGFGTWVAKKVKDNSDAKKAKKSLAAHQG